MLPYEKILFQLPLYNQKHYSFYSFLPDGVFFSNWIHKNALTSEMRQTFAKTNICGEELTSFIPYQVMFLIQPKDFITMLLG